MTGFTTSAPDYLIRSNVWSAQLKDVLQDELMAMKWVKQLTDFPDGDTFNIPSIGQAEVDDYVEDQSIKYRAMDTGNFTFTVDKYKSSATYITDKAKQDGYYVSEVVSSFVPKQSRAIMEAIETDVLALANSQTLSATNTINGAKHRFVAGGTNEVITIADFAKARFALKKANVPDTNLVAIVDPSVEYTINTLSNLVNVSNNPRWEGIIESGISTGMSFVKNIYGFDVYVSNHLPTANETISGVTTAAGKANIFFSAAPDVLPFVFAMRQPPRVESQRNIDFQRDEFVTTCRYGKKLYRPENLVVVLADTDQV